MLKNENKRDNLFILTNVVNVSEQHSKDFSSRDLVGQTSWVMLVPAVLFLCFITWKVL